MRIAKIQATVHVRMHVRSYVMTKHNRKLRPDMEGSYVHMLAMINTLTRHTYIVKLCWHSFDMQKYKVAIMPALYVRKISNTWCQFHN